MSVMNCNHEVSDKHVGHSLSQAKKIKGSLGSDQGIVNIFISL